MSSYTPEYTDNQTDSGMVLASEEFERIENRHRKEGAFSSKGSNQNTDPTVDQSKPRGRGRPLYQSELRGQTFYNSEYGELSEQSEEGSCTPPTEGTSPSLLHASFFSD